MEAWVKSDRKLDGILEFERQMLAPGAKVAQLRHKEELIQCASTPLLHSTAVLTVETNT